MALSGFQDQGIATPYGMVHLSITPPVPDTVRPLVFLIPGVLAELQPAADLVKGLGILADACVMRLPSSREFALSTMALAELSRMVTGLLETRFAHRRIVLVGISTGAVLALGVRAANVQRIVAVEPALATANLWPVAEAMRRHVEALGDPIAKAFAAEAFGVGQSGQGARDHFAALHGLDLPVDVLMGGMPLMPERKVDRVPSLVDAPERRRLAAMPGVRLHISQDSGHNIVGQDARAVKLLLQEACRRAGAVMSRERLRLDEPLLEAVPITADSVLYWGGQGAVFSDALGRLAPNCDVVTMPDAPVTAPTAPVNGFEVLALERPPSAQELAELVPALRAGGHLVARWKTPDQELRTLLQASGLVLREAVDSGGTGVIRAQKSPPAAVRRPLVLQTVACAPDMMDIRTRLPVQGLRSDPDLQIVYTVPPWGLPSLPLDAPKIVVLQRPAGTDEGFWRGLIARIHREGWLAVVEFDDYPPLIDEVFGRPRSEGMLRIFSFFHAVQTSAPPLVDLFRPYNPEVALFPNAAFGLTPFPTGERPRRVFYGAMIRGTYAAQVAASLGPAIEAFPDTEFVVLGDRHVFNALPTRLKRYYEYMSFEAYLELMSQCSISLSPIDALWMRETKSDAKFIDAARAGALTIASPTIYDRVIQSGVNGLIAPTVSDWAPLLIHALTDSEARERMARKAWDYVRTERMFANQVAQRRDWYRDLWARRDELTEAVMNRVPGMRQAISA